VPDILKAHHDRTVSRFRLQGENATMGAFVDAIAGFAVAMHPIDMP
jgi:hypothetical protein